MCNVAADARTLNAESLLTITEAAQYLGCSVVTIRKGSIPIPETRTKGNHRRYRLADVQRYAAELEANDPKRFRRRLTPAAASMS